MNLGRGKGRGGTGTDTSSHGTGTDTSSQTEWSCPPETVCLLASTAEQAVRLAGLWSGTGTSRGTGTGTDTSRCTGAGTVNSRGTGTDTSSCQFFDIAAGDAGDISACEKEDQVETELVPDVISYYPSTRVAPAIESYNALISACEKGDKVEVARALFAEVQQRGLPPEAITYTALGLPQFAGMQQRGLSTEELQSELGKWAEKAIEAESYELTIRACEEGHKTEKAMDLDPKRPSWADISACEKGDEVKLVDLTPNVNTYNVAISACEKEDQVEKACDLFAEMQQSGLDPDADTYDALISACVKGNMVEKAWEQLAEMIDMGSFIALVRACEKNHKVEKALEQFSPEQSATMQPLNLPPEVTTYNGVSVLARRGQVEEAIELTVEMQQRLSAVETPLYNDSAVGVRSVRFCACKENHQAEKAMQLGGAGLQQRGSEPNVLSDTTLISAREENHQAEKAMQLGGDLKQRGLEPNVAISACEKSHNGEKAIGLHGEMQHVDLIPEVSTYNAQTRACEKSNKAEKYEAEEAMELFAEDCLQSELGIWAEAACALISACEQEDIADHQAGKAMEPDGGDMQQRGLEPNVAISACEKSHNGEKAIGLHGEMQQVDLIPEVSTYNAQTKACEKSNKAEKAMQLGGGGQQQRGLEPIVIADTTLISACEEDEVEEAMELLPETQQRGIDPDVITYEALVSACDKDHKIDTMERFAEMQKSDRHTYTALISASEKGESVEKAMELFDEMILRTFKALFMGCEDNKVAENAMKRVVARQKYMITQSGLGMKCRKERVVAMVLFADMQKLDMEQWHCTQRWTRATR